MLKNININKFKWFTLIEIIVAITILSIIMVSVIMIFVEATDLSNKLDINRVIQENTKNIIETLSEDIKKNWVKKCGWWITKWCISDDLFSVSNELWIWENHYYISKKDILWNYIKVLDLNECSQLQCYIVKNGIILSNSYVNINKIEFSIFNEHVTKVQVNLLMKPLLKNIKKDDSVSNEINIQTTIGENNFNN